MAKRCSKHFCLETSKCARAERSINDWKKKQLTHLQQAQISSFTKFCENVTESRLHHQGRATLAALFLSQISATERTAWTFRCKVCVACRCPEELPVCRNCESCKIADITLDVIITWLVDGDPESEPPPSVKQSPTTQSQIDWLKERRQSEGFADELRRAVELLRMRCDHHQTANIVAKLKDAICDLYSCKITWCRGEATCQLRDEDFDKWADAYPTQYPIESRELVRRLVEQVRALRLHHNGGLAKSRWRIYYLLQQEEILPQILKCEKCIDCARDCLCPSCENCRKRDENLEQIASEADNSAKTQRALAGLRISCEHHGCSSYAEVQEIFRKCRERKPPNRQQRAEPLPLPGPLLRRINLSNLPHLARRLCLHVQNNDPRRREKLELIPLTVICYFKQGEKRPADDDIWYFFSTYASTAARNKLEPLCEVVQKETVVRLGHGILNTLTQGLEGLIGQEVGAVPRLRLRPGGVLDPKRNYGLYVPRPEDDLLESLLAEAIDGQVIHVSGFHGSGKSSMVTRVRKLKLAERYPRQIELTLAAYQYGAQAVMELERRANEFEDPDAGQLLIVLDEVGDLFIWTELREWVSRRFPHSVMVTISMPSVSLPIEGVIKVEVHDFTPRQFCLLAVALDIDSLLVPKEKEILHRLFGGVPYLSHVVLRALSLHYCSMAKPESYFQGAKARMVVSVLSLVTQTRLSQLTDLS